MHEPSLDYRALLDLDALVVHVSFDPGARLEFESLGGVNWPVDGAVHDNVRGLDFAVDAGLLGDHQGSRLIGHRRDIAAYHAVHAQAAAEYDVPLDASRSADQAVDAVLRLARFVEHCAYPSLSQCHRLRCSGLSRSALVHAHLHAFHLRLRADPESPLDSLEVLESQLESGRPGICRLGKA